MASGLAILGNQMLRSYAVWDNGWRPLKPETHLKNDALYAMRKNILQVTQSGMLENPM